MVTFSWYARVGVRLCHRRCIPSLTLERFTGASLLTVGYFDFSTLRLFVTEKTPGTPFA